VIRGGIVHKAGGAANGNSPRGWACAPVNNIVVRQSRAVAPGLGKPPELETGRAARCGGDDPFVLAAARAASGRQGWCFNGTAEGSAPRFQPAAGAPPHGVGSDGVELLACSTVNWPAAMWGQPLQETAGPSGRWGCGMPSISRWRRLPLA